MNDKWEEALEDGETIEEGVTETWRWGTWERRVFRLDGKTYAVDYQCQPEHGIVASGDPDVYEVEPQEVTITKWVKVE